jgi:hypothetical protein
MAFSDLLLPVFKKYLGFVGVTYLSLAALNLRKSVEEIEVSDKTQIAHFISSLKTELTDEARKDFVNEILAFK